MDGLTIPCEQVFGPIVYIWWRRGKARGAGLLPRSYAVVPGSWREAAD